MQFQHLIIGLVHTRHPLRPGIRRPTTWPPQEGLPIEVMAQLAYKNTVVNVTAHIQSSCTLRSKKIPTTPRNEPESPYLLVEQLDKVYTELQIVGWRAREIQ